MSVEGDNAMNRLKAEIMRLQGELQRHNDQVQASVDKTKSQNNANQEQFDQNKILQRFKNKVGKRFSKNSKNNGKFVNLINRLETIGFGYRKTYKGKVLGNFWNSFPAKK